MINLRINFSRLTKKFILIFICFYPVIVFSAENELLKIIEKNWNETNTMVGRFNQLLDNNETVAGDFFIQKPFQSKFTYDNNLQTISSNDEIIPRNSDFNTEYKQEDQAVTDNEVLNDLMKPKEHEHDNDHDNDHDHEPECNNNDDEYKITPVGIDAYNEHEYYYKLH